MGLAIIKENDFYRYTMERKIVILLDHFRKQLVPNYLTINATSLIQKILLAPLLILKIKK